jgi:hypothetical protein
MSPFPEQEGKILRFLWGIPFLRRCVEDIKEVCNKSLHDCPKYRNWNQNLFEILRASKSSNLLPHHPIENKRFKAFEKNILLVFHSKYFHNLVKKKSKLLCRYVHTDETGNNDFTKMSGRTIPSLFAAIPTSSSFNS